MTRSRVRGFVRSPAGFVFFGGLLLRLVIMPWAMHADLLSMYWRANLMVSHGIWQLPTNQYLGHVIYALNLAWMKLLGFNLVEIFPVEHYGLSVNSMTASVGDWLRFNELSQVNEVLFWLKMPHLLSDIGIFFLLYTYLKKTKFRTFALMMWWINPVNLYAFYVFSRHDAITLLFVLLAMIFAARSRIAASLIFLFVAVQVRVQPLMYMPIFLVDYWKYRLSLRSLLRNILLASFVIILYLIIVDLIPVNLDSYYSIFPPVSGSTSTGVEAIGLPTRLARRGFESNYFSLPIFAISYGLTLLLYWRRTKGTTFLLRLHGLNLGLLVIGASYFATQVFSPHYFVWLSLFPVIATAFNRKYAAVYSLCVLFWILAGSLAPGSFSINQDLFLPVSTLLFYTPKLPDLLNSTPNAQVVSSHALYIFSTICLRISLGVLALQSLFDLANKKIQIKKMVIGTSILLIMVGGMFNARQVTAALIPAIDNGRIDEGMGLGNLILGQTFVSPVDSFGAIQVKFNTHNNSQPTRIQFRIRPTNSDDWWYQASYSTADFYNMAYYPFGFPEITSALGREFIFEIQADPVSVDLGLPTNNDYPDGEVYIDGVKTNQDLAFRVDQNLPLSEVATAVQQKVWDAHRDQVRFFVMYYALILLVLITCVYSGLSLIRNNQHT